ncbi:MAG: class II aldolase/adducin family protein [Clostridiales bacterium]|nr:class II aldolase/adducin family protein [Clostridiales bacterium]
MTKTEAAKAFLELAAQLRHEGLLAKESGPVKAALRLEDGAAVVAELDGADITIQELGAAPEGEPFLRAFLIKPEAKALLLLRGTYAPRIADAMRALRAELDDMAQIVGLTARVARALEPRELARCLRGRNSCFVREHGMLITGRSLTEALTGAILLEKAAMTHILAQKIGGAKRVPLFSAALMHLIYQKKYSKINLGAESAREQTAQAGEAEGGPVRTEREQTLREQIVACGRRLVEEGLVQGTWGNLAVRLDDAYMLCTPSGLDYRYLTPDDVVKVELATLSYGAQRKPTSEKRLHRDLFTARNDVGAAIHTHAKLCGVFAAARKSISGGTDAALRCAGHALPSTGKLSRVAIQALGERSGCLLMNHGVLCCGADLESACQTCRAAEEAARGQLGL